MNKHKYYSPPAHTNNNQFNRNIKELRQKLVNANNYINGPRNQMPARSKFFLISPKESLQNSPRTRDIKRTQNKGINPVSSHKTIPNSRLLPKSPPQRTNLNTGSNLPTPKSRPSRPSPQHKLLQQVPLPLTPSKVFKYYYEYLTDYQQGQILSHTQIFYFGHKAISKKRSLGSKYGKQIHNIKGEYFYLTGDHIAYRYQIVNVLGKGSFGTVLKVYDHKDQISLSMKILNASKSKRTGQTQLEILQQIKNLDVFDSYNVLSYIDAFIFRGHICFTAELLDINLYQALKRNNFQGLPIPIIRVVAKQLLQALCFLGQLQVIHCDIKPENILLKTFSKFDIKLIDFGSSCKQYNQVYTYIQSRYYRAPEVMLGIPYSRAIDIWSFGCVLVELFTSYPLFMGQNEQFQFRAIMECLGIPPKSLLVRGRRTQKFFDSSFFPLVIQCEEQKRQRRKDRKLENILRGAQKSFVDFVRSKNYLGCLEWIPEKRMTPEEALVHPWIANGSRWLRRVSPTMANVKQKNQETGINSRRPGDFG